MKSRFISRLLIPVSCFAAAWALAHWGSGWIGKTAPPTGTTGSVPTAPTKRNREQPRRSVEQVANDFRVRPMAEWAAIWEDFASQATAKDLEKLPPLYPAGRRGEPQEENDLLQKLAREELAVRAARPVALTAEASGALAEADPAAAWRNLEQHNLWDASVATMRTLARRDPLATLRRFQAMPAPYREMRDSDEGRRAAVWHTPLGAIFGAWARQDPLAAAAAVRDLPEDDRSEAINELAMTWAFQDGPAAIRYLLGLQLSANVWTSRHIRLDVVLRASFRTQPATTARLLQENAILRSAMGQPPCQYVVLRSWYDADPDRVLAWLQEPVEDRKESFYWLMRSFGGQPEEAARILRQLSAAGFPVDPRYVRGVHRVDPVQGEALADELGIDLAADPNGERLRTVDDPEDACDRWLAALAEQGDAEQALTALGWDRETACRLAVRASGIFPQKAAELAKRVPAAMLDCDSLRLPSAWRITRYWPDLAGKIEERTTQSYSSGRHFPEAEFRLDPAQAAEALLATEPTPDDVGKAIKSWAPYDPAAAQAWLERIPEGELREKGERALVECQALYVPAQALERLARRGIPEDHSDGLWRKSLGKVMASGGDWRSALAQLPAEPAAERQAVEESLERDARLLELARKGAR